MQSKLMFDGKIRVYEDGRIDRIGIDGKETPAKIHLIGGHKNEYAAVSVGGRLRYVHRIVAEAFVEPHYGEVVNHKDGCKLNNKANNLEWCAPKDNVKHAHDTKLIDHYKNEFVCAVCNEPVTDKWGEVHGRLCGRCERLVAAEACRKVKRMRLETMSEDLEYASKERKAEIFRDLHEHGFTTREIGGLCGISHERVRQIMEVG